MSSASAACDSFIKLLAHHRPPLALPVYFNWDNVLRDSWFLESLVGIVSFMV